MHFIRSVLKVVGPSAASIAATTLGAIVILFAGSWPFISSTNVLFTALLGQDAPTGVTEIVQEQIKGVDQLLANDRLGSLTVFLFWGLIGLIVFSLLTYALTSIQELEEDVEVAKNVQADSQHRLGPLQFTIGHMIFRVGVLVLGIIYTLVLVRYFIPVFLAFFKIGILDISNLVGWTYLLTSVAGVAVCLHGYIILARLFVLRYRVIS